MRFEYILHWDERGKYRPQKHTIKIEGPHLDDHIMRSIAKQQSFYEHDLLLHLALRGSRGGLFIDVGAHIGNHSIYFGKFLADYVVCIEPSRDLQRMLKNNLELNAIKNYVILDCAIGSKTSVGRLTYPSSDVINTGLGRIVLRDGEDDNNDNYELVQIKSLDSIVTDLEKLLVDIPLQLVKIDVEGMQIDVLKGAKTTLRNHRPQLVVEAESYGEQIEIKELLAEFGYEPVGQFCATPTFHFINPDVHRLRRLPISYTALRKIPSQLRWKIRRFVKRLSIL